MKNWTQEAIDKLPPGMVAKPPKYRNEKVVVDGIKFDSKREAKAYQELSLMERAGIISDLRLQVKFELLSAQYEHYEVQGKRKVLQKKKCIEKSCSYYADFTYMQDGVLHVVDSKGVKTKEYLIKRKMMLALRGIQIKEI